MSADHYISIELRKKFWNQRLTAASMTDVNEDDIKGRMIWGSSFIFSHPLLCLLSSRTNLTPPATRAKPSLKPVYSSMAISLMEPIIHTLSTSRIHCIHNHSHLVSSVVNPGKY